MRLLLDSNAFLRWTMNATLPRSVHRVLAKPDTECLISIVTGWEIAIKTKLRLKTSDVEDSIRKIGAAVLPIEFAHLDELARLPLIENHRDPFDRMLIAQALSEDVPIVSSDERFRSYRRLRVLWD